MDLTTKKTKPRRRVLHEEDYNRDGRWTRSFTVRQEVWPIIEHWATENSYHLVALKAKKRSYQKSSGPGWYTTVVEMKQNENEFTITSWIRVGFTARALTLFLHPTEFQIYASGWKGSVARRKACAELNVLLDNMRQAAITDSLGFHLSDLDSTTRLLGGLLLLPLGFFISGTMAQLDSSPTLAADLFKLIGKPLGVLAGASVVLFSIHNFFIVKKFRRPLWKAISTGTVFTVLSILSAFCFSTATQETTRQRYVYYCFGKHADPKCKSLKEKLSPKDLEWALEATREFEKALSVKPKSP